MGPCTIPYRALAAKFPTIKNAAKVQSAASKSTNPEVKALLAKFRACALTGRKRKTSKKSSKRSSVHKKAKRSSTRRR